MKMEQSRVQELEQLCAKFRLELLQMLYRVQTGHPGGSLSAVELITALYFEKMKLDPENPRLEDRDRFILSKGHAAPVLYVALAHRGFFPVSELTGLRQLGSRLQGHPCAHKLPGVELSTGPLGLGLSAGLGAALSAKLTGHDYTVYVLLGDGEIQEGCVWEGAMSAAKFKPGNLVAILDHNGVQLDGTNEEIMPLGDVKAKFEAFGWRVISTDGHDIEAVCESLDEARAWKQGPVLIVAETVKGKGISFMEGKHIWHGRPIGTEDYRLALSELGGEGL